jgi:hypothetical protein
MENLVIFGGFGHEKQTQTKPILFSPQIYLGVENEFEKTKPICQWDKLV